MKRDLILIALVAAISVVLTCSLMPDDEEESTIPQIITRIDTLEKLPEWLDDSLKRWRKRVHTTDTVNLVTERVVIRTDTAFIRIPCDTAERSRLQPVVSYFGGSRFGDTALVTTFSLRTGFATISKVFIPGILTAMVADSVTGTPAFTFEPFPAQKGTSLWTKLKWAGVGFAGCSVYNTVIQK